MVPPTTTHVNIFRGGIGTIVQKNTESGKKNARKVPWKSPLPPQPCLPPCERAVVDLVCQPRLGFGVFPLSQRSRDLLAVQFPRFICSPEKLIAGYIPKINTLDCAVYLMTFPHFAVIKSRLRPAVLLSVKFLLFWEVPFHTASSQLPSCK